jgi:DNA-directed RNA polymerase subunit F
MEWESACPEKLLKKILDLLPKLIDKIRALLVKILRLMQWGVAKR